MSSLSLSALYAQLKHIAVPRTTFINWGRTYACNPLAVFEPESDYHCELVLDLARREQKTVRAVGLGHSPSDLACTTGYMLRMHKLNKVLEVDPEKRWVIVQAGITLAQLHIELAKHGLAMINVGSISEQTLAGIVSTASHGSGVNYGVMSTHVIALTILLPDGSRVTCSRHAHRDLFMASICGLGSTGLILSIQLQVEPAFRLREVQETFEFEHVMQDLDRVVFAAEHVRFWWFPTTGTIRVSSSDRTHEPKSPAGSWLWHSFVGHHVIQLLLFIARYFSFLNLWIGSLAAWLVRDKMIGVDDSHAIFNVDCRYPQYTTEWAIPYDKASACLRDLRAWFDVEYADPKGLRPHFPVEIRFSAADDIWLSPSNGRQTCWIGIVQYKPYGFSVPYRKYFRSFEEIVTRYQGKPHWAKAHRMRPNDLDRLYPHFKDFVRILEAVDPQGMFRNAYVQRHIFGKEGPQVDDRVFKPPFNCR